MAFSRRYRPARPALTEYKLTTTVRIEKRQRGVFGWLFFTLFWGFNAVMAYGLFGGLSGNIEQGAKLSSDAARAGHAIGTAMGVGMILFIWVLGAVLLGVMVILTRGKKIITETTQ